MCGILGLHNSNGVAPPGERFAAALDRLRSRGPDDSGIWHDERVALGHRRLSIVDLSPTGRQPMESSDRRYTIVFNGEIYNHRELRPLLSPLNGWRGTSDTETLLEAYRTWGVGCLSRINGMFAFAIWDRAERTLFAARDRMGVKPFYYAERGTSIAFASRPSALTTLLDGGLEIDPEALRVYLELGYVPAPLSFHRGVQKLPPAHYLLSDSRGTRRVRYWDYRCITPERSWSSRKEEDLIEELQALISDAVRVRLMSDVPLGAFLSGGVDSALIVAAMKSAGVAHPKAFTIGFNEPRFNEAPAAAKIAERLGIDHVVEMLDVNDLLSLLPEYIEQFDEPFADSSAFPTMALARLAQRHVTVALSGDGADELFGGYHYYPLMTRISPVMRWRRPWRSRVQRALRMLPGHRGKLLAGALDSRGNIALFNYLRSTGKHFPTLISSDVLPSTSGSEIWFEQFATGFAVDLPAAETGMRLDAGITLPGLFLQKVDVATMAYSLEARCPMTDYRLVEWAMRLPAEYKIRNGQTKYLLKKALCKHLSPELVYRPKMGFGVPIARWLREDPLREWAQSLVHDDGLMSRLPLDRIRVRDLLRQQSSAKGESHPLVWSLLMLLCFVQRYHGEGALPAIPYREVA